MCVVSHRVRLLSLLHVILLPFLPLGKGWWWYRFYHVAVSLLSLGYTVPLIYIHHTPLYKNTLQHYAKVLFVVCIPHLSHLPTLNVVKHLLMWIDNALPLALP
jgi:hypothetical protein